MKTKMDELTFGVEIEVMMPHNATPVGGHGNGVQVPWLPAGWLADGDPSLPYNARKRGVEFVSPILKGADGLRQVVAALRAIAAHGGSVTTRGGLHVHVGWPTAAKVMPLKRLCNSTALHEPALYAITGTKSRERGRWCRSLRDLLAAVNTGDVASIHRQVRTYGRYYCLNLENLVTGRRPTVEFRAFGGTLSPTKVVAYVHFCLSQVCRAINAPAYIPKDAKPAHELRRYRRLGRGAAALAYWMDCYGWTTSKRQAYTLTMPADLPSLNEQATELRRLASKYDRQS